MPDKAGTSKFAEKKSAPPSKTNVPEQQPPAKPAKAAEDQDFFVTAEKAEESINLKTGKGDDS